MAMESGFSGSGLLVAVMVISAHAGELLVEDMAKEPEFSQSELVVAVMVKRVYSYLEIKNKMHLDFWCICSVLERGFISVISSNSSFCDNAEVVASFAVYVVDINLTKTLEELEKIASYLKTKFEMMDLGKTRLSLDMKFKHYSDGILGYQSNYTTKVLPLSIHMIYHTLYANETLEKVMESEVPYLSSTFALCYTCLIALDMISHSLLIYWVARSKHGIFLSQRKYVLDLLAETITVVSQFMYSPSEAHIDAVICILRYLKMAPDRGLVFSKNVHLNVKGYTNAYLASSITGRQFISGYFAFVGDNLVTWRSKKQKLVATSSVEVEFRAMKNSCSCSNCELQSGETRGAMGQQTMIYGHVFL
ncbi:uncharacterized mitochondrial protein AtMg00810-like [Malus domestica]|uniref:uncharacterized mitochondrial protein AtMg00810-like n=1 Tax=Malus domestica TaxID=3750 RepID=UPI003974A786